jgi:Lar family restriction alleviation protein
MDKLKPCPFCGHRAVEYRAAELVSQAWVIVCDECYAQGPIVSRENEAPKYWNRRARRAKEGA